MTERGRWERQWRILAELRAARRGRTASQLQEAVRVGRSTVYRDLRAMVAAGLPFRKDRVGGEVRYRFDESFPSLRPEGAQRRMLEWARMFLRPFAGTTAFEALERLLEGDPREDPGAVSATAVPTAQPHVLRAIESALGTHRLRIRYRDRQGETSRRLVDPLALHFTGRDLYLLAHCLRSDEPRTFKVLRIQHADVLPEPIAVRPIDPHGTFGRSVKAFTGDPLDVVVRLAPSVAAIAGEYPLVADQTIEAQPDGAAIVRARVAGYLETLRWVLSWGAAAEALEPPILRDAARSELLGALGRYGPGLKRVVPGRVTHPGATSDPPGDGPKAP